jgi:hypothetical protein
MAIDRRGHDTQRLFEAVCRALGAHRRGAHFPKIATDIIRLTHEGYELLGLADGGEQVAYYDPTCGEIILIPFDKHGLKRSQTEFVATGVDHHQSWLTENRQRMVWTVTQ